MSVRKQPKINGLVSRHNNGTWNLQYNKSNDYATRLSSLLWLYCLTI